MRQAGSKDYAHELVELLPGSQVDQAIEMLESFVGTKNLALVGVFADEGSGGEDREMPENEQLVSCAGPDDPA